MPDAIDRKRHVASLDGLRGLAALVVVMRHSLGAVDFPTSTVDRILASPLVLFFNGAGAVQLFFVLSGFVLAASLSRQRTARDLPQYFLRRIFRIHPPYMFAVLVAWSASFFYVETLRASGVGPWVEILSRIHLTGWQLANSMRFPGDAYRQLSVGWSLEVEMIFSFLMPMLFLFAMRTHWLPLLVLCAVPLAVGESGHRVFKFGIDFGVGIALFLERGWLSTFLGKLRGVAAMMFIGSSLLLFIAPWLLGWKPSPAGDPRSILVMVVGAAGLTAAAAFLPLASGWLSIRPCRFLGRISYSLYLLHYPLVLLLAPHLVRRPLGVEDPLLLFLAVLVLVLPLADLSYRFVELPAIGFGNGLCAWMARQMKTSFVGSRLGR